MARLAAQAQAEYYPTPLEVVDLIAPYIQMGSSKERFTRLFDPCCGEGLALARLAAQLRERFAVPLQTWGNELHPERAAAAAARLDLALCAPFETLSWTPRSGAANILFLNPPYDWSEDKATRRVEDYFIEQATPALVPGGLLIYLVPPAALDREAYRKLFLAYQDLTLFRFPDPHFDAFKQLVIFGIRRERDAQVEYWDAVQAGAEIFGKYGYGTLTVDQVREKFPPLAPPTAESRLFKVPLLGSHQARLYRSKWESEEVEAALERQTPPNTFQPDAAGSIEMLVEPKVGHLAQLLSSGLLDTLTLPGEIVRGRAMPRMQLHDVVEAGTKTEQIYRTTWETTIMRVTPAGLEQYAGAAALPFLEKHAARLGEVLRSRLRPYGNHSTPAERALLGTLSQERLRPDGSGDCGLYDDQQDTAIAAARALERHGVAHLVCEMGWGKTTAAGAVIALRDAYPAFVMCPPHVVDKWERELRAIIPGVQVAQVRTFAELQAAAAAHQPDEKLVVIAPTSIIKLGSGWEHAPATRHTLRSVNPEVAAAYRQRFREAAQPYRVARAALRSSGPLPPPGPWPLEGDAAWYTDQHAEVARLRQQALAVTVAQVVCPDCGKPLDHEAWQRATSGKPKPYVCRRAVPTPAAYASEAEATDEDEEGAEGAESATHRACRARVWQFMRKFNRWPLDIYIQKQLPNFFALLVVDEVHQMKGASERGESFGRLSQTIPQTLTLTGTFFGGVASSLYLLLYRSQREFRQEWGKHEVQRWIETYGRIQQTYTETETHSAYGAKRRTSVNVKEIPGIAPAVLRHLLHTTVFKKLSDLGIQLPPLYDEVVTLPMSAAQEKDYKRVERHTWELVKEYRNRYLSSWLQWTLSRPNSCFRKELVKGVRSSEDLEVPAVVEGEELLPKEAWLVNKARTELAEGRKVIVYVRQTATRDIQPRLLKILRDAGLPAQQLPSSLTPRKREAWLKKQQPAVLIVNAKKVETGLDLVMYQTAVFYEIEYSLYTVWQAMRRVWRQGQHKPVRIYYLTYAGTMEERAMSLIAKKMTAAQLLYGDDVAGALVDEDVGDGSLALELLKILEAGGDFERATSIFGKDDGATQSPVGSPTRTSPPLGLAKEVQHYLAGEGLSAAQFAALSRRKRREVFAEAQQTLW